MAVVQLAYLPAALRRDLARSPLEDPLFDVQHLDRLDALLPDGMTSPPDALRQELKDLRRRIRAAYSDQLLRRVLAALDACQVFGAEIVVLPEYSVPFELLDPLAVAAQELVVVAGTHAVEGAARRSQVYEHLGAARPPRLRESVCPVLHGGKLIGLQPKLSPAELERDVMLPGETWDPIALPGDPSRSMGVLICLDFLYRESEQHRALVTLDASDFLAVPSLTPYASLTEFHGRAEVDARRYKRPVLYCNHADFGGSAIHMDERSLPFPEGPGSLSKGDEGVLLADLWFERVPAGRSTSYTQPKLVLPVAAATFVHGALPSEGAYAAWLETLPGDAGLEDGDLDALQAFAERARGAEAMLREAGRTGIRKQRLSRLLDEIDEATSLERLRQFTREILLPADALPLPALRAALALGAADVMSGWLERFGAEVHEFGEVERRLRREGNVAIWSGTDTLTPGGRRAFEEIAQRVRGGVAARSREALASVVEAYRGAAREGLDARQKEAQRAFDEGRFDDARSLFRGMLVRAEEVLAKQPDDEEMRRWGARCRLNVAACSLNLQQVEEAAAELRQIDAALLSARGRCMLAECLMYTGDLDGARAALPAEEPTLTGEERERLAEVRQILVLREGELPADLGPSSAVQRQAAELLLERDDLDGAARHALGALDSAETQAWLTRASALQILIASLKRSIYEEPPSARVIALERREEVVQRIERELGAMRFDALPSAIRRELRRWQAAYYGLVFEAERLQALVTKRRDTVEEPASALDQEAAARALAEEGKLEEALAVLPPVGHPWLGRWQRAELAAIAGAKDPALQDRALAEALELAEAAQGKAPIDYLTSTLLCQRGRDEEALPYVQAAFAALPGRGQRLLLAQLLLNTGRSDEAWGVLQPLREDRSPRVTVLLAQAAETGAPREAPTLWATYLEARADDGFAKARRAQALFKIGERTEAAEAAWAALRQHGDALDAHTIFVCASLQQLRGEADELSRERVQEAAALLRRRFPGDPQAEFLRFQLLVPLEGMLEAEPIDYGLLMQEGLLEAVPTNQAIARIQQAQDVKKAIDQFYREGGLPFASLCEATGTPAPRKIAVLVHRAHVESGTFCAPAALEAGEPAISLEGAELLVSDLELDLLQHLGLLPRLKEALGRAGKLVLLQETRQRILQDAADLEHTAPRDRLKRYDRLAALVARLPKHARDGSEEGVWRVDGGAAPPSMRRLSLHGLAQRLFEEGRIDDQQRGTLLTGLPVEPATPWPDPAPERMEISSRALERLSDADALRALLEAFPGRLQIDPETEARIHKERARLGFEVEAADLAQEVEQVVAHGLGIWIRLTTAPEPPALPPLRKEEGLSRETQEQFAVGPLRQMLAIRSLMDRDKHLRRLTADCFGSFRLGHPDQIRQFAWPKEESFLDLLQWNREVAARDLYLPALVRLLLRGPKGDETLRRLAELGFPDALGASELLRLERRYGGLAKAEPRRRLDRMEWMAREPGHLDGEMARLRIAAVYSKAIWLAFCDNEGGEEGPTTAARVPSEPKREVLALAPRLDHADAAALAAELLRRVEALSADADAAFLDHLLLRVTLKACGRPLAFIARNGEMAALDPESPGSRLWRFLYETWAPGNPDRRAALGRAAREALCVLDEMHPEGPTLPQMMPVVVVMQVSRHKGRGRLQLSLEQPELEAISILSAHWKNKPLGNSEIDISTEDRRPSQRIKVEEPLAYGAAMLGRSEEIGADERAFCYLFPLHGLSEPVEIVAPIEALLLRAEPQMLADVARRWARWQGHHDGRAYRLMSRIAEHPENLALRREYARLTTTALWRLVREDPAFLLRWPERRGIGIAMRVPRLADLREVLSEPEGPLPAEPIENWLTRRLDPGEPWAETQRLDRRELFLLASEVPGSLPAVTVGSKLADDVYAEEVEAALDRLDHPDDHPAARLAGDLYFLRFAAANNPQLHLRVGEIDLSKELPDRVARLLANVAEPPKAGTFAAVEGALLRACQQVVVRLGRTERLDARDRLWLTYRLFQWLTQQLSAMGAEDRRAGMSRLAQAAPPAEERAEHLLDPVHFDARFFDHRLATVLYALAAMEALARHPTAQQEEAQAPPHAISSAALETKLAEIAARPSRVLSHHSTLDAMLGWSAHAEIPELALAALLGRNPDALLTLTLEARLRWLEALPEVPEALETGQRTLAEWIAVAAANSAGKLDSAERAAFEAKLRGMDESPTGRRLRWLGLSSLFGPAAPHLEAEARELLLAHLEDSQAPLLCGRFLSAISALDPTRLEGEVEALLTLAAERGEAGQGVILVGAARVALAGPANARAPARELVGRLARRPPFNEDPNVLQILRFLQVPEPSP